MTFIEKRTAYKAINDRRILFVHPSYNRSFGSFYNIYQFFPGARGLMSPLGILIVANYLPQRWIIRIVDENVRTLTDADLDWADVLFISGMHIQKPNILRIQQRAHGRGKMTVLGGCSVSAAPEDYPDMDVIHCGELGDATDELIELVDKTPVGSYPKNQIRLNTLERIPLADFPCPAYHLIDMSSYLVTPMQFSSGCPYTCEFCDIPALYGRNARLKPIEKIIHELDVIKQRGHVGTIYFVDDNFIANQKAAKDLLPALAQWQKENNYPFDFGMEATINLAKRTDILEAMKEAYVTDCYFGIESPEENTLKDIDKKQNLGMPLVDALNKVRSYGIEALAGVILGFDSDTEKTEQCLLKFIDECNCPLIAVNLLFALPKTPLWDRLTMEKRLLPDEKAYHTNIRFKMPNEIVLAMWRNCTRAAYEPGAVYRRYQHNMETTYRARLQLRTGRFGRGPNQLPKLGYILTKILWTIGLRSSYRKEFWQQIKRTLCEGDLEHAIKISVMGHHFIEYGKECENTSVRASYYTKA